MSEPTLGDVGMQILDRLRASLKDAWDELPEESKKGARRAAERMGKLLLAKASGKDIEPEWVHVEAQLANWTFVGAVEAKKAFWRSVRDVAEVAGAALARAALAAAKSELHL